MSNPEVIKSPQRSAAKMPAIYRFFTSYGLACVVLIIMTIVTLIGTIEQGPLGLYAAKKKFFHSIFFIYEIGGKVPVPIPGGLLLMSLLFVNLALGALLRVRKRWRGAGMLVAHSGMIFLLVSGFVTWAFTNEGFMALYPNQESNRIEAYRTWQLEILPVDENGEATEALVIPIDELRSLDRGEERLFRSEKLPFDLAVSDFAPNGVAMSETTQDTSNQTEWSSDAVNGFKLFALRKRWKDEKRINIPGMVVEFRPAGGGDATRAILSGESAAFDAREQHMPFVFEQDGKKFAAQVVKKSWLVPYTVRLDKFIFERHPGVMTAKNFESRITRIEQGAPEAKVAIRMNEPMRHDGLVFFQESFGPANAGPNQEMYSQFAVNDNPADQWPLYALIVTGIGLLLHFLIKLVDYINRATMARRAEPQTPAEA